MLFRPDRQDFSLIGFYTGKVVYGLGAVMLIPAAAALAFGEHNDLFGFLVGAALAVIVGAASQMTLHPTATLRTSHGLSIVALAWLVAPVFAAVPLLLSGHYASYLDAYFEGMSGFATIGLTLVNDIDHLAHSVNLWRHMLQFLGGQGIIVVVLTIFAVAGGRIGALYTAEGREERILPNVVSTARFIWRVAFVYAVLGTLLLWLALVGHAGLPPLSSLLHALNLFAAAFDTGGFAPTSASAAFYRSVVVEAVFVVLMIAGAFSFAVHYQLWQGRRRELRDNLESRTLAVSVLALFTLLAIGLARAGTVAEFEGVFRIGFFQAIAAHTTTGLTTVPGRLLLTDWGMLAPAMLVVGMALGGMAGSTAGGIKAVRVGMLVKGLRRDIRRVLLPENAVVIESYHSTTRRVLADRHLRAAATMLLLFLVAYLGGGMVGLFYGYPIEQALFESTAATSSGGLSVGIVRPGLEWPLKVVYIAEMVLGRLEFIAVFALAGYVVAIVGGRR